MNPYEQILAAAKHVVELPGPWPDGYVAAQGQAIQALATAIAAVERAPNGEWTQEATSNAGWYWIWSPWWHDHINICELRAGSAPTDRCFRWSEPIPEPPAPEVKP